MTFNYEDVGHPPLHPHCRCTLVAVLIDKMVEEAPAAEAVEFVPAKSVKEAETWARQNGIRFTDYAGLSVDDANGVNKGLVEAIRNGQILPDSIRTGAGEILSPLQQVLIGDTSRVGGVTRFGGPKNPKAVTKVWINDNYRSAYVNRGWTRARNFEQITSHELAHAHHVERFKEAFGDSLSTREKFQEWADAKIDTGGTLGREAIDKFVEDGNGSYAFSSQGEFVAESAAIWGRPERMPTAVRSMFERAVGKVMGVSW
jgi:hypothetical protein